MAQSLPLQFEGPTPESVILNACAAHGPDVRLSAPARVRSGGIAGFFAKTTYRVTVIPNTPVPERAGAPSAATVASAHLDPIEQLLSSEPDVTMSFSTDKRDDFATALTRAASALGDAVASRPSPATPTAPAPAPAFEQSPHEEIPTSGFDWDALLADSTYSDGRSMRRRDAEAPRGNDIVTDAQLAGVPASILSRAIAAEHGTSLLELMSTLPPAPALPRVNGSLVALVGTGPSLLEAARTAARRLGRSPSDVAIALIGTRRSKSTAREIGVTESRLGELAPDLLVHNAREAATLAPGWRRDRVGIVAIFLSEQPNSVVQARELLAAIRPSVVYALAPAAAKPEDVAVAVRGLGGVDALHLEGCKSTFTPASICSLGIPIARLDGEEATPERWSIVVSDAATRRRLAEQEPEHA